MNANLNFDLLFNQLPEQELWQLLQDLIASEIELPDQTVEQLDDRMQGFLFLQESVNNREARIRFARSAEHMTYLRDAAGSRNVWMSDDEFSELVNDNDSTTLACFARSDQMKPHHLAYIEYKLGVQPHRADLLASSYETSITLKKALEKQDNSWEMALFRLARTALDGADTDPRALWQAYLNLKNMDQDAVLSTGRPVRTSKTAARSIH
ncbi:MAG: hypothetical protein OES53_06365 [Xanthomonadales bacterium]|jgi:hypothetical protein|nr:hypothetical protein [Xanthomonadales bacterium]MDH3924766.1 hypothetical protein [Xanthomonadales bacterium]MDH3942017.1 hypothetical protein [Xanthomonadales bacterium]MDH4002570.1 hypothetical protein [Xanthomonadales bacterium]